MDAVYGYVDYTLEAEPRPFYVGIGNAARIKQKKRNKEHALIIEKLGWQRIIEFVSSSSIVVEAWEVSTMLDYHTYVHDPSYNGIGCNLVKGGHRNTGRVDTMETRLKRGRAAANARKGKLYPAMGNAWRGKTRPPRSKRWKQHLSNALAGKPRPGARKPRPAVGAKISKAMKGNRNGCGSHHCGMCGLPGHTRQTCQRRSHGV